VIRALVITLRFVCISSPLGPAAVFPVRRS
jgi:hypothetical protein